MQLFYNPSASNSSLSFTFEKEESKHIHKVLRKAIGDILFVTNGLGSLFETEIISISDTKCNVKVLQVKNYEAPKFKIHLAVAPTKMNDRFEWFLEKATEIGIQEITPVFCNRSERKAINSERFEKVILAAMKQSNQYFLPRLNQPIKLSEFLKKPFKGQKFIAHCEESDKSQLFQECLPKMDYHLLIGPEGDFTSDEIQTAIKHDFIPVSLGNTRLRTETAAVVGCHILNLKNEN
ncbi:16S rRNA (uracil(1498)-N(3))-methyltransferase [Flavobacterium sp.]|uniref:16S rRNA (uracil(1498)-N(3))-methyltransferase n=1 Tax=Flavobacterium sp. TaxID=239 RepID=UPI002FDA78FA